MENTNKHSFNVTDIQKAYLIGRNENFELGSTGTHVYREIKTKLNIERLNVALDKTIEKHEILRTIFILATQQQRILDDIPKYTIDYKDISGLSQEQQKVLIEEQRATMSHEVFNPEQWPLFNLKAFKLDDEYNYIFFGFDLLVGDGFSLRLLEQDLLDFYKNPSLPTAIGYSFKEYMDAYDKQKSTRKYLRSQEFQMNRVNELPLGPSLTLKMNAGDVKKQLFKRKEWVIATERWEAFKTIAQKYHVTPTTLLCSIYADVLNLWSSERTFTLNLTVFNRYPFHKDVVRIMGDFTSVILLDVDYTQNQSFEKRIENVQKRILQLLSFRYFDGVSLLREIGKKRNTGTKALTPVVFTSLISGKDADESQERLGDFVYGISQTPQVYLDNQVADQGNQLTIIWDYVDELFEDSVIEDMFQQYLLSINSLIDTTVYKEPVISLKTHSFIDKYNRTSKSFNYKTLDELFLLQAAEMPDKKAVVSPNYEYTYEELNKRSNQIANFLLSKGVKSNTCVGVLTQREGKTIANILGILKAGGTYVPIAPDCPEDRVAYILKQSNTDILLEAGSYDREGVQAFSDKNVCGNSRLSDLAYIIFTSGSTGNPKGVMIQHIAAVNTILDITEKFGINVNDRIIGLSSMGFDLSVYDIFGALSAGATLYMVPNITDIDNICDIISQYQITFWNSVPSVIELLVKGLSVSCDKKYVKYESLRNILLSGDWIPVSLPHQIKHYFPNSNIISLGGATEASIWSIYYPISNVNPEWKSIPYGYPLSNQQMFILNNKLEFCPIGVEGEIFIGGIGVASGYLNDEEKTQHSFIEHPKLGYVYRTGDYGMLHQEGYMEFRGRKDAQVKIRGHRIELGEIESQLLKHDAVSQAIVVVHDFSENDRKIIAYLVPAQGYIENVNISSAVLKDFLSAKLPQYMVPVIFMFIDEVPLTANQKVDRKMLPSPVFKENIIKESDPGNNDPIRRTVNAICCRLLEIEEISDTSNFFELGGDSLLAYQIIVQIEAELKVKLPISTLYKNPTVSGIITYIKSTTSVCAHEENEMQADNQRIIYWNSGATWRIDNDQLIINDCTYQGIELFPGLYFETQKGVQRNQLEKILQADNGKLDQCINALLNDGILLTRLPSWARIFEPVNKMFHSKYGEDVIYDSIKYNAFKKEQMERGSLTEGTTIPLKVRDSSFPNLISQRRSYRNFDEKKVMAFDLFSNLLSVFMQENHNGKYVYSYASAGGLYPIDVFLYIKEGKVENVNGGLYYYHPASHTIKLVCNGCITDESSYHNNKEIFKSSSITFYLVYNATANMPVYKGNGYYYAAIDTGIMVETLTYFCESNDLGVCSVGDMNFDSIAGHFNLSPNQIFMHSVEVGFKPEQALTYDEIAQIHRTSLSTSI